MRGLLIPSASSDPCLLVEVEPAKVAAAIGAELFELVRERWLRDRRMVLVVDEEGLLRPNRPNVRATRFYPHGAGIVGDALILAEVDTGDGPDLGSLNGAQVATLVGLDFLDSIQDGPAAGGR